MVMLTIWPVHVGRQINQFRSLFSRWIKNGALQQENIDGCHDGDVRRQWLKSKPSSHKFFEARGKAEVKGHLSVKVYGESGWEGRKREKVSKRNQHLLLRPTGRRSRARWCKQEVEKRAWSHGRARYCHHTHVRHLHADKCKTLLQDSPTFPCRVGMQPRLKACSRWDISFKGFNSNADQIKICIIMIKTPYCEAATLSLAASQGRQSAGVEH